VPEAVRRLRKSLGNSVFIAADVCLCAYTESGHCGLLQGEEIDNDGTLPVLADMSLILAQAGVDMVAPSDMMDGRVTAIRQRLDTEGFSHVSILAYSAKYASGYYGPFREAADSAPAFGDRESYQMDFRNRREALKEVALDEAEGADMVMVKPALAYLDVIAAVRELTRLPVAAYNVSGEYAAVKLLAESGLASERALVLENLCAIKRAGADIILTYHLRDVLREKWL
jgi:porphobilinogen synthase